jgi:hypothetical protein
MVRIVAADIAARRRSDEPADNCTRRDRAATDSYRRRTDPCADQAAAQNAFRGRVEARAAREKGGENGKSCDLAHGEPRSG